MGHHYGLDMWLGDASGTEIGKEGIMAKRSVHSFKKFQKELKRKKKAKEKMERRQGKKDPETEAEADKE
jgi:hypothetical protein